MPGRVAAGVIAGALPDIKVLVGSRVRFEELYRAYAGAVLTSVRRRTDASAADDVVAEVFLIAWRRLDEIPAEPLPWLLGVARGVLANRRRSDSRRLALHDRLRAEELAAAGRASSQDHDERVLRALDALGERDREVLYLVTWDDLESKQAARVLGVRSGTFAVRLHRARRRFARALAAQDAVERRESTRQPTDVEVV